MSLTDGAPPGAGVGDEAGQLAGEPRPLRHQRHDERGDQPREQDEHHQEHQEGGQRPASSCQHPSLDPADDRIQGDGEEGTDDHPGQHLPGLDDDVEQQRGRENQTDRGEDGPDRHGATVGH